MEFDVGSTFSESSIRSAEPSQFMWNRVTRGFEARMFLWSWKNMRRKQNIDKVNQNYGSHVTVSITFQPNKHYQ